jgi:hypothetical protein
LHILSRLRFNCFERDTDEIEKFFGRFRFRATTTGGKSNAG